MAVDIQQFFDVPGQGPNIHSLPSPAASSTSVDSIASDDDGEQLLIELTKTLKELKINELKKRDNTATQAKFDSIKKQIMRHYLMQTLLWNKLAEEDRSDHGSVHALCDLDQMEVDPFKNMELDSTGEDLREILDPGVIVTNDDDEEDLAGTARPRKNLSPDSDEFMDFTYPEMHDDERRTYMENDRAKSWSEGPPATKFRPEFQTARQHGQYWRYDRNQFVTTHQMEDMTAGSWRPLMESIGETEYVKGSVEFRHITSVTDIAHLAAQDPSRGGKVTDEDRDFDGTSQVVTKEPLPTDGHNRTVILVRPAREKALKFEAPFTAERFIRMARALYSTNPVGTNGKPALAMEVAVICPQTRERQIYSDLKWQTEEFSKIELTMFRQAPIDTEFLVVRIFHYLRVQDGRDISNFYILPLIVSGPRNADGAHEPAEVAQAHDSRIPFRQDFERGLCKLLDMDPKQANQAMAQVDRFKGEWLDWSSEMTDEEFRLKIFWKIDDPIINVYPMNWIPSDTFEQAEEKRAIRLVKQQRAQAQLNTGETQIAGVNTRTERFERPDRAEIQEGFERGQRGTIEEDISGLQADRSKNTIPIPESDHPQQQEQRLLFEGWVVQQLQTIARGIATLQAGLLNGQHEEILAAQEAVLTLQHRALELMEAQENDAEGEHDHGIERQAANQDELVAGETSGLTSSERRVTRTRMNVRRENLLRQRLQDGHWNQHEQDDSRCMKHRFCHALLSSFSDQQRTEHDLMHEERHNTPSTLDRGPWGGDLLGELAPEESLLEETQSSEDRTKKSLRRNTPIRSTRKQDDQRTGSTAKGSDILAVPGERISEYCPRCLTQLRKSNKVKHMEKCAFHDSQIERLTRRQVEYRKKRKMAAASPENVRRKRNQSADNRPRSKRRKINE